MFFFGGAVGVEFGTVSGQGFFSFKKDGTFVGWVDSWNR